MRDATPQLILLSDYKKHDFRIDTIHLTFELAPTQTVVTATSSIRRNGTHHHDLVLDGEKMLLQYVKIDDVLALRGGGDWHTAYLCLYRKLEATKNN